MTNLKDLRNSLLALGQRRGLKPEEAEDAAQEALVALASVKPPPTNPLAYAEGVVWKQAAKHLRKRKRTAEDVVDVPAPTPDPAEALADAAAWAQAEAAMEQALMWGRAGRTQRIINSLADVNPDAIMADQRFYLAVIAHLPKGTKQQERDRKAFEEMLREALPWSGYLYARYGDEEVERNSEPPPPPGSERPLPPDTETYEMHDPYSRKVHRVEVVTEYYLSRGLRIIDRFAPDLPHEEAVALLRTVRAMVFPRWAAAASASPMAAANAHPVSGKRPRRRSKSSTARKGSGK